MYSRGGRNRLGQGELSADQLDTDDDHAQPEECVRRDPDVARPGEPDENQPNPRHEGPPAQPSPEHMR
jgi:hypothetical protein